MWQAGQAVLHERLAPENFDREFSVGCMEQNPGVYDSNTGDNVGRFLRVPLEGVFAFDEEMVFTFVIANSPGFGVGEE